MRFFLYALYMNEIKFYSIIDSLPKRQRDGINLETVVDLPKQFQAQYLIRINNEIKIL